MNVSLSHCAGCAEPGVPELDKAASGIVSFGDLELGSPTLAPVLSKVLTRRPSSFRHSKGPCALDPQPWAGFPELDLKQASFLLIPACASACKPEGSEWCLSRCSQ